MNLTANCSSSWCWVGYNKVFMTFFQTCDQRKFQWSSLPRLGTIGKKSIYSMQALCRRVCCCWVYLTRVQPTQTHPITSTASPDTLSNSQTPLHHITNASASTSATPKNQSYPPQLWREPYHHHHDHNDDQKVWTDNLLFSFDVDNASASPGARYPLDSASPGKNKMSTSSSWS